MDMVQDSNTNPAMELISRELKEYCEKIHDSQKNNFKKNWEKKWKKLFSWIHFEWIELFLGQVIQLEQNKFEEVNYIFFKFEQTLQICDFLKESQQTPRYWDTDKIIVSILICAAEAFYRVNKPHVTLSINLIKWFFNPVREKLKYKISSHYPKNMPYIKEFDAIDTIFWVRNDYIHNANFLGTFFLHDSLSEWVTQFWEFKYSKKSHKSKLISINSKCSMKYNDFLVIYKEAFWKNIMKYLNNHSPLWKN